MCWEAQMKAKIFRAIFFMLFSGLLLTSGCARYARNVSDLYEPTTLIRNGSGEVYIVIQESQQTQSPDVKWVLGKVLDDDKNKIDEVLSPRSGAELIQAALEQELKKSGYSTFPTAKKPSTSTYMVDLTKTDIDLDQVSDTVDLKATCRIVAGMDIYKNGALIKKLQFEALSSKTDIRDRDQLARNVLREALQSVMSKATPELHELFRN